MRKISLINENIVEERKSIRIEKWIFGIIIPPVLFGIFMNLLFNATYDFIDYNIIYTQEFRFNCNHIIITLFYLIPILIYFKIADVRKYKKGMIILGAIINIILLSLLDIFEMYYYGAGSGWEALGGFMIILETAAPNLLIGSVLCLGVYALMKRKVKIFSVLLLLGMAVVAYYF